MDGIRSAYAAAAAGPVMVGELFFYFLIYSALGWLLEGSYNLYTAGTFRKEGFMKGPVKPMYGLAPVILIAAGGTGLPLPLLLLLALLVPTAVEYASGALLKKVFRKQWWDYSSMPRQLHGHICLKFSLYWWVLMLACLYGLHPLLEALYRSVREAWSLAMPAAAIAFAADLGWTVIRRRRAAKAPLLRGTG